MTYRSPLAKKENALTTQLIGKLEVPWEFTSLTEEYRALREKAGLLDYSYLGRLEITGENALDFLQAQLAWDIEFLMPEQSMPCLLLTGEARPVDMVMVYNQEDHFLVESSPAGRDIVSNLLKTAAPGGVTVKDLSATFGVLGLEGPYAWQVLGQVLDFEVSVLAYQGFLAVKWAGEQLLISRSGFTAEYGYKIYAPPEVIVKLWPVFKEKCRPVGYRVLEVAMLEVRQPNIYRELADDGTVIRCGFNWLVDIQKENFCGKKALQAQREAGQDYLTVGFTISRDVELAVGNPVAAVDTEVGRVSYFLYSPGLDKILGVARLKREWVASGISLQVQDIHGQWHLAPTCSAPYITPKSWSTVIA